MSTALLVMFICYPMLIIGCLILAYGINKWRYGYHGESLLFIIISAIIISLGIFLIKIFM